MKRPFKTAIFAVILAAVSTAEISWTDWTEERSCSVERPCSQLKLYALGKSKIVEGLTVYDIAFRIIPADQRANTVDVVFVIETDDHVMNTLRRGDIPIDKEFRSAKAFWFAHTQPDHPVVTVLGVDTVEKDLEGKIIGTHRFR